MAGGADHGLRPCCLVRVAEGASFQCPCRARRHVHREEVLARLVHAANPARKQNTNANAFRRDRKHPSRAPDATLYLQPHANTTLSEYPDPRSTSPAASQGANVVADVWYFPVIARRHAHVDEVRCWKKLVQGSSSFATWLTRNCSNALQSAT